MFLEILLGVLIVIFIADYFKRELIIKRLGNIPLVSKIPFIGTFLVLHQLDPDHYAVQWHEFVQKFGKTFASIIFGFVTVVTVDHRISDVLLASQSNLRKNFVYKMLNCWLGDGLLLSNGKKWQAMRKIITPTFHFKILEEFVDVFDRQTNVLIQKLALTDGRSPVNIYDQMGLLTMDIIAETAMGVKVNAQMDSKSEFVQAVNEVTEIMANRFVRPHLSLKIFARKMLDTQNRGIKIMHTFTEKIISERKQSLLSKAEGDVSTAMEDDHDGIGTKKRMAFLDVLLSSATADGQPLSDKQIRDEVNTFMFEGHDTTTSAISFCLYILSRHKDIQQKLFEEIRSHFGDDLSRPVTYADLQQMNYLNCVIKESLRLHPPIPAIGRTLDQDLKIDEDCILSSGTNVIVLLWEMLRDPAIFEDPLIFKPERHLLNENSKSSSYSNIPFSAGPRNCIGQRFALLEMRTVIVKILRNFELFPLGQEIQISMKIVLRSNTGVNIGLKPRCYN